MANRTCDDDAPRSESARATLLAAIVSADQMINSLTALRAGLIDQLRTDTLDPAQAPAAPGDPEVDLDLREVTAELACALRLPHTSAAHLLDDAHALVTLLPATASALATGAISYRHAQTMIDVVAALDPDQRAHAETLLIPRATVLTASAFTRAAHRTRDSLDPTPLADRHAAAASGRRVHVEADADAMAWLHAYLPATTAMAIFHRVSDAAAALAHPDDPRTLPQLRADALAALTLDDDAREAFTHALGRLHNAGDAQETDGGHHPSGANRTGRDATDWESANDQYWTRSRDSAQLMRQTLRGIRPTVAVTVPVLTLLGGDQPAELEGYGPIDPDTARQLCAGALSFLRILTHPHTGAVLGVDRDRYTVPADLKAWLRLRDQTCRFPGCARRATRCDLDHVTDWAYGGTTDQTNLIHLCRAHHRLRHTTRWRATLTTMPLAATTADGPRSASVRWTAPSGRTYTTTDALTGRTTGVDNWTAPSSPVSDANDASASHDPPGDPPPEGGLEPYPRFPDIPPLS